MNQALIEVKKLCFIELGGEYYCCWTCLTSKKLLIHHQKYNDYSFSYDKFANSDVGRLQYYSKLLDEIKLFGENLFILCFDCHSEFHRLTKLPMHEISFICHKTSPEKWYNKTVMEELLDNWRENNSK